MHVLVYFLPVFILAIAFVLDHLAIWACRRGYRRPFNIAVVLGILAVPVISWAQVSAFDDWRSSKTVTEVDFEAGTITYQIVQVSNTIYLDSSPGPAKGPPDVITVVKLQAKGDKLVEVSRKVFHRQERTVQDTWEVTK